MFRRKLTALDYHNPSGFDCTGKNFNSTTARNDNQDTHDDRQVCKNMLINQDSKTGQSVERANLNQRTREV